jgi:acetyl-CoA C-acetyltransferase
MGVAVMGVGIAGFNTTSTGLSYRELIARAARMAYTDAGITLDHIDGAVTADEDFISGYSIADEYTPDQLGVVRKPVYTVPGDFLHALGSAIMQLQTGKYRCLVVSGYSKASNILTKDEVVRFGFDPVFNRFSVSPHYLGGLEMRAFLARSPHSLVDVAEVVVANRRHALLNPIASFGADMDVRDVLESRMVADPLTEAMIPKHTDGCVVAVLGTDEMAEELARLPVYVAGAGWGSATSILEHRELGMSLGTATAADWAYKEARITEPAREIDAAFVSDLYPHRQLMHLDALGLSGFDSDLVNPQGGTQGVGDNFEVTGGVRFYEAVQQLRGEAGPCQIDAERVLVHGWRGLPTDTCAVAILDDERRLS